EYGNCFEHLHGILQFKKLENYGHPERLACRSSECVSTLELRPGREADRRITFLQCIADHHFPARTTLLNSAPRQPANSTAPAAMGTGGVIATTIAASATTTPMASASRPSSTNKPASSPKMLMKVFMK